MSGMDERAGSGRIHPFYPRARATRLRSAAPSPCARSTRPAPVREQRLALVLAPSAARSAPPRATSPPPRPASQTPVGDPGQVRGARAPSSRRSRARPPAPRARPPGTASASGWRPPRRRPSAPPARRRLRPPGRAPRRRSDRRSPPARPAPGARGPGRASGRRSSRARTGPSAASRGRSARGRSRRRRSIERAPPAPRVSAAESMIPRPSRSHCTAAPVTKTAASSA